MPEHKHEPIYYLLGVPLRSGSLYPGSENDAQAYRDTRLVKKKQRGQVSILDGSSA